MKRLIIFLALGLGLVMPLLAFAGSTSAIDIFGYCNNNNSVNGKPAVCTDAQNPGGNNPIIHGLKVTIDVISLIVGFAAVFGIIINALRMIVANGDSNAIASARSGLLYSLIGLAVTALAQSIVVFVLDKVK